MINRSIFLFSIIGFLISAFLAYEYSLPTPIACPVLEGGCEAVKNSAYSKLLGISLPYFGVAYFLAVSVISVVYNSVVEKVLLRKIRLFVGFCGLLFSGYLTSIEAFVIKEYCFWCLGIALTTLIIFILILIERKNSYDQ